MLNKIRNNRESAMSCFARYSLAVFVATLLSTAANAGPKAYIGNFGDNTVSAVDTATGKVVATIPVAAGPHGMAITPDGRTVYVSGDGSSSVSVIDTASDTVTKTIEVGKTPNGVTLTPDGKQLLVTIYGDNKIVFVDTATQAIMGEAAVAKPHTVSLAPGGKIAYVTSQEPGKFGLSVLDLATKSVTKAIPLEKTPRDGEFGDGKMFYFTQAGIAAVQVFDPAAVKLVGEIPTGVSPHSIYISGGAGYIVVQGPGELAQFDPQTNKVTRSITVGKQPHWATVSDDGKTAFVTNEGSNDLAIINLADGKTTTVAVGKAPRKVVVQSVSAKRAELGTGSASKISIANFAFAPAAITVRRGTAVSWSNDDGSPHAVAFKDGSPGAKSLLPKDSFDRTFDTAGTFDYFCSFHPYMTAKVVVTAE
jgi:YVTN family beta-propeller protein